MKNKYKIRIDTKSGGIKIYILGLIHLHIADIQDFIGFQSWFMGENFYIIEFYTKDKTIQCSYNDFEKWKTILILLDKL